MGAGVGGGGEGWCLGQVERSGLGGGQGSACRPIHKIEIPHNCLTTSSNLDFLQSTHGSILPWLREEVIYIVWVKWKDQV